MRSPPRLLPILLLVGLPAFCFFSSAAPTQLDKPTEASKNDNITIKIPAQVTDDTCVVVLLNGELVLKENYEVTNQSLVIKSAAIGKYKLVVLHGDDFFQKTIVVCDQTSTPGSKAIVTTENVQTVSAQEKVDATNEKLTKALIGKDEQRDAEAEEKNLRDSLLPPAVEKEKPVPSDLGLKDYLKKRREFFRIPEFDQEPDKTAAELQRMYADLAAEAKIQAKTKERATREEAVQERVGKVLKKHKDEIGPILDKKPGRRDDWEPLIKDVVGEIQRLVNEDKFDAGDLRHWVKAAEELSEGFGDLELILRNLRDLTPADRRGMAQAGGATSSAANGHYIGGTSLGAVWHARKMARIRRVHERRLYRIKAISGRY